ncbi:MAG: acyl-CoA dehydrogenase C-terminal domain-containing protein, partial [Xanthobacteraceae bacterium]
EASAYVKEHTGDEAMKPYVVPLGQALAHLQQATMWLMQNALAKPDNGGAAATDFMHLFGLVTLGYMWCRIAEAARGKIAAGANGSAATLNAKLMAGRFFMDRVLPETAAHLARIQSGADHVMEMPEEAF